jgi:hypothetical protein
MKKPEESIAIVKANSLTLNDVLRLRAEGREIVYTPHIGNRWREDLYLARAGIPSALVSRNQAYVDTIDRPHQVRVSGKDLQLASEEQRGILLPFIVADGSDVAEIERTFPEYVGLSPATMHLRSNIAAVPGACVEVDRLLFLQDEFSSRVVDVLAAVAEAKTYRVFTRNIAGGRMVDALGEETQQDVQRWMDVCRVLISNVETGIVDRSVVGPVPTNAFMIMAHAFRELFRLMNEGGGGIENPQVYTVSGPSMINYVRSLQFEMSEIYRIARDRFPGLPPSFTYNFVPGANFDFVPTVSETDSAAIVNDALELMESSNDMSARIAAGGPERNAIIDERSKLRKRIFDISKEFAAVRPSMSFVSQYDVLRGEALIDPPFLRDVPLCDIDRFFRATT